MILADTNVLFGLFVQTPWSGLARELHEREADWRTEAHALVELTNVLVRYVRVKRIGTAQALMVLAAAEAQFATGLIVASHSDAVRIAVSRKTSAYDARFLTVASQLGVKLVTEDLKLRRAAPALTQSIEQALRT
jgi:predicted nucleic acid-binding protein